MGIELKNRIEADLAVSLPMATLVQGPSISQLAAQLVDLSLDTLATATAAPPARPQEDAPDRLPLDGQQADEILARLDTLSDVEVDTLLESLLEETAERS
jgi:hypothetical protein